MNQPLRSVAIVLVVFLLPFLADNCSDLMDGLFPTVQSTDLTNSPDRTVQAAGQSEAAINRRLQAYDAENEALSTANVGRAENMSFEKIDKAIELNPNDHKKYLHKAAMQIAVGQSPSEAEGKAFTAFGADSKLDIDFYFPLAYRLALRDVSVNLPPGAARDRVNARLCPWVKDYRKRLPDGRDYDGVVCP